MAFSSAYPRSTRRAYVRERALDVIRVGAGAISLLGAILIALLLRAEGVMFVALIAGGLFAFAVGMISFGRLVTRRWLAFGAGLGFVPASRRPLLDLGTDRPVLFGRAGVHPARLRLVLSRARGGNREWLEAETDLLTRVTDIREQYARASTAARAIAPLARVRVHDGRVALRAPFDPTDTLRVLAALREAADAIEQR